MNAGSSGAPEIQTWSSGGCLLVDASTGLSGTPARLAATAEGRASACKLGPALLYFFQPLRGCHVYTAPPDEVAVTLDSDPKKHWDYTQMLA